MFKSGDRTEGSALSDDDVIAEVNRHSGELDAMALTDRFAKCGTPWPDVQNAIQRGLDKGRLGFDPDMHLIVRSKRDRDAA